MARPHPKTETNRIDGETFAIGFTVNGLPVDGRDVAKYLGPGNALKALRRSLRFKIKQALRRLSGKSSLKAEEGSDALRAAILASAVPQAGTGGRNAYERWLLAHDTPTEDDLCFIASNPIAGVSVVVDVSTETSHLLCRTIESIVGCIGLEFDVYVRCTGSLKTFSHALRDRLSRETRVQLLAAEALPPRLGTLLIVRAGSVLRPHGAWALLKALEQRPDRMLAYGDSDILSPRGELSDPWLKPASTTYVADFPALAGNVVAIRPGCSDGAIEREIATSAETFSRLLVALARMLPEGAIGHCPHVTHHDLELRKPIVSAPPPALANQLPHVSIIIPTRDGLDLLQACVESLVKTDWPRDRLQIVIADNGSRDPATLKLLHKLDESDGTTVVRIDEPFNFARINNCAIEHASGDLLILMNNDIEIAQADWLRRMAGYAMQDDVGVVGIKLVYPDRTIQHGGVVGGVYGLVAHAHRHLDLDQQGYNGLAAIDHEILAVTGACVAIRKETYLRLGGMREALRVAFNDIVLCLDCAAAGLRNIYVGTSWLIHHESKSRGFDDTLEKAIEAKREATTAHRLHASVISQDPYYSPFLSLTDTYELSTAPRRPPAWDSLSARPLHVLILSQVHGIGHGVARAIEIFARALLAAGYKVTIGGPPAADEVNYSGCHRVDIVSDQHAAAYAARERVDIIFSNTPPFFSVARWIGGHVKRVAYDYGEPPVDWFPDASNRRQVQIEKDLVLAMSDKVFAISNTVADENPGRVDAIVPMANSHLAVWDETWRAVRERVRAEHGWTGKRVVLDVCRFLPLERRYKGVDTFAAVGARLKTSSDDWVFVLAGRGDDASVEAMQRDGLTVVEGPSDEALAGLYAAADAYANFSRWEGYNLGIGQALAMGLPTIASDIPAHRAFGIPTTNDVGEAASRLAEMAVIDGPRDPKVWSWEDSCAILVREIDALADEIRRERPLHMLS